MKLGYTILYVADVPAALDHYRDAFGCKVSFLHDSNLYGEIATGNTVLGFAAHQMAEMNGVDMRASDPTQSTGPVNITFVTEDVAGHYAQAVANGAVAVKPPTTKPWGQVSGYLRDIDGHLVEIASPIHERHT